METEMIKVLMVSIGGATGCVFRYWVSGLSQRLFDNPFFPYGTLTVNVVGCLLIGFLGGISETRQIFSPEVRILIFVGFLGGFTTFSTFGYEIFMAARDGQFIPALANLLFHLVLGFGSVWLGFIISKLF
jgi:CrcB protein